MLICTAPICLNDPPKMVHRSTYYSHLNVSLNIIMACLLYQKIRKAYYYKVIREAETPVVSAFFQDSKGDFDR